MRKKGIGKEWQLTDMGILIKSSKFNEENIRTEMVMALTRRVTLMDKLENSKENIEW